MKAMQSLIVIAAVFVAVAGVAAQATDVTGKWVLTVQTSAGGGTPTLELEQDGQKLTGHYTSSQLGEADVTGTVEGSRITVRFGVDVQGTHLDVVYTGTLESKDSMKGTVNLGGLGEGTFTGKKQ
jgi:opacity protein-like surface antigen